MRLLASRWTHGGSDEDDLTLDFLKQKLFPILLLLSPLLVRHLSFFLF